METKTEKIEEVEANWNEVEKREGSGKFFKPELDRMYKLRFKSAKPVKSEKFKDKNGNPKIRVILGIASIDGKVSDLTWETGSWAVMNTIKPFAVAGLLEKCEFLLKQKKEGEKVSYIFEEISGVKSTPPSSFNDDVLEAFL
jgi:hypothetical protein